MDVLLNLDVSSEEFFNFLTLSVVKDVKESTNKNISQKDIVKGFHYTKQLANKLKREGSAKVIIRRFVANEIYEAGFETNQGLNTITYEVETLDDNTIDVKYTEDYIASDKIKGWNYNLVNMFYEKRAKKKAIALIRNIEAYILQNRGVTD